MKKEPTMFDLPDDAILYDALSARDPAFEGRAYVGVTSTGIFCRLTCPARKPRPENCRWFARPEEAEAAGHEAIKQLYLDGEYVRSSDEQRYDESYGEFWDRWN